MRHLLLMTIAASFLLAAPPGEAASNVQKTGRLGLGVELGFPGNGVSANWFMGKDVSLQIDGTIWSREDWMGFGARVDLLWWMPRIKRWRWADLVWYWGPGGHAFWFDWHGSGEVEAYLGVGAELPAGAGFQFRRAPIDLMLEVVPVMHVLGEHGVDLRFGVAGALAARWYF